MVHIRISDRDRDALARTAMSEVGHFGRYGEAVLEGGVEAVVDTIINRVAHPRFPNSIEKVVNAPFQFSAIGARGGSGTWDRLRPASSAVRAIVDRHLHDRAHGKSCTVGGATHFLNPHLSSRNALQQWGNHVVRNRVAVWGRGKDIHYHGFAPGETPPSPYTFTCDGASCEFSGDGVAVDGGMDLVEDLIASETDVDAPTGLEPVTKQTEAAGEMPAYKVERVSPNELDQLEDTLNGLAEEGWRLRQIVPERKDLLLVLEGLRLADRDAEVDESIGAEVIGELSEALEAGGSQAVEALVSPVPEGGDFDMAAFTAMIESLNLKYFKPTEFLVLGNQHFTGRCKGKNTLPPRALWENIKPTARVLDALRERLGAPIRTLSVYRSPAYNACIPGAAGGSVHMNFMAVDFKCDAAGGPVHWARQLKALRDVGMFKGGIGVYQSFVHVDTRGRNANFGPLMGRVF